MGSEGSIYEGLLQIITGLDDLRSDSAATAFVFFAGLPNNPVSIDLKDANQGEFDAGQAFEVTFDIPSSLSFYAGDLWGGLVGVSSVTITITENPSYPLESADNWDIGAVSVRLNGPQFSDEICQIDEIETFSQLGGTNDPGVVRLTGSAPSASIPLTGMSTGCASTGSPLPESPAQVQFIVSTGNDTICPDSDANVQIFGLNSSTPFVEYDMNPGHNGNHQPGDVANGIMAPPPDAPPVTQWTVVVNLWSHNNILEGETDDHWDVGTINVMRWSASGPAVCVVHKTGDPAIPQLDGRFGIPFDPNCN